MSLSTESIEQRLDQTIVGVSVGYVPRSLCASAGDESLAVATESTRSSMPGIKEGDKDEVSIIEKLGTEEIIGGAAVENVTRLLLVCSTMAGRCQRVDIGSALLKVQSTVPAEAQSTVKTAGAVPTDITSGTTAGSTSSISESAAPVPTSIFFYHTGDVGAVACSSEKSEQGMICTGGDDCLLCVWDSITHKLLTRAVVPVRSAPTSFFLTCI